MVHNLFPIAGNLSVDGCWPPTFDRSTKEEHGPTIRLIPTFHSSQPVSDLCVVVAVVNADDVPTVGRPLSTDIVISKFFLDDASDQFVVDSGVVIGKQDAKTLTNALRDRLRF